MIRSLSRQSLRHSWPKHQPLLPLQTEWMIAVWLDRLDNLDKRVPRLLLPRNSRPCRMHQSR